MEAWYGAVMNKIEPLRYQLSRKGIDPYCPPVPPPGPPVRESIYPFLKLAVGDSIFFNSRSAAHIKSVFKRMRGRGRIPATYKIRCSKVGEKSCRIWRVA